MTMIKGLRVAAPLAALAFLGACQPSVASMDCGEIAEEAQRIWGESQDALKVTAIRNPQEVRRNDNEARCTGEATLSDNSTATINMRAYKAENGSVMVESGGQPFPD